MYSTEITPLQLSGSNIQINGIGTVDGNATGIAGSHSSACIGSNIEGTCLGAYISGITFTNALMWPANITNAKNVTFSKCTFSNSSNAVEFVDCDNCHFINCYEFNVTDLGIGMYGGCTNCSVRDCITIGTGPFIYADSPTRGPCSNCIISGNIITNSGTVIVVYDNNAGVTHSDCQIIGNIIRWTAPQTNMLGFNFTNTCNPMVSNNQIVPANDTTPIQIGVQTHGIAQNLVFQNNYIGTSKEYVLIGGDTTDAEPGGFYIFGCRFFNGSTTSATVGISVPTTLATGYYVIISDCTFIGLFNAEIIGGNSTQMIRNTLSGQMSNYTIDPILRANGGITVQLSSQIHSGTGVPTISAPQGSLFLRTDGGIGARLYVGQGATSWAAVAGV